MNRPISDPSWLCIWICILCWLICCPSLWLVYFSHSIYLLALLVRPCGPLVVIAWKVSFCLTVMFEFLAISAYLCGLYLSWLYRYSLWPCRCSYSLLPPHIFCIYESCASDSFYCVFCFSFSPEWSWSIISFELFLVHFVFNRLFI